MYMNTVVYRISIRSLKNFYILKRANNATVARFTQNSHSAWVEVMAFKSNFLES